MAECRCAEAIRDPGYHPRPDRVFYRDGAMHFCAIHACVMVPDQAPGWVIPRLPAHPHHPDEMHHHG